MVKIFGWYDNEAGYASRMVDMMKLGIPVATSLNGKDAIPGTHPLSVGVVGTYSRSSANRAVNRARRRPYPSEGDWFR